MRCGDFKESYREDEEIFQSLFVRICLAVLFVFLIITPFFASSYVLYIMNLIGIAIIGAVGLNLLTGFTGQISLGHAAFVGVGGYATAILVTRLDMPFWFAMPIAGFVSAGMGLIIGIPSLRVKGLYLCIATLAAQFILEFVFVHWESMTHGIRGINVPAPRIGSFVFDTEKSYYFITLVLVILTVGFARNLVRTKWGRAFVAIRDRDLAAEIIGINLFRYKLAAFALSSFFAGIAGSLWVGFIKVVTPEHFPFSLSIQYLAMVIVGGLGSVLGFHLWSHIHDAYPGASKHFRKFRQTAIPWFGPIFHPAERNYLWWHDRDLPGPGTSWSGGNLASYQELLPALAFFELKVDFRPMNCRFKH